MGKSMSDADIHPAAVREQLRRVLASVAFGKAERSAALLKYIVEQTLDGKGDRLKEYSLGVEALGRGASFDPRIDTVVRAEVSRLRTRLDQYYNADGRSDTLVISLPKGAYVAQFDTRSSTDATSAANDHSTRRYTLMTLLAAACAGIALTLAIANWTYRSSQPDSPESASTVQQFEVELKSDGVLGSDVGNDIAISSDGQRIAFISRGADARAYLNVRRLDAVEAIKLDGTEGARVPFFSPDGRWIGFYADRTLKKVASEGGAPVIICEIDDMMGASWSDGDTIVFGMPPPSKHLWKVSARGGKPQVAIAVPDAQGTIGWPQLLPGGRHVLFSANGTVGADRGSIDVRALNGDEHKVLITGGTYGRYHASGHLTYVNQGTLFAAPFDLESLSVQGPAVPVVRDVSYSQLFGYAQYEVARNGTLVYRKGIENALSVIERIDRSGTRTPLLAKPGRYGWLRVSPDGKSIAVAVTESGARRVLIHEIASGATHTLSAGDGNFVGLTWYRGGLFYGGVNGMNWIDARGESESKRFASENIEVPWSLTPDEKRLAFHIRNQQGGFDLWTASIEQRGDSFDIGAREPFTRTAAFEFFPTFSPDGRWLAYSSDESGVSEVYVRRFPDNGDAVKVSSGGGWPHWSPTRSELLYQTDDRRIMSAAYRTEGDRFITESPRQWMPQTLKDTGVEQNFDIEPDGEHIIALMPAPQQSSQSPNHATFILNFQKEIERKMVEQ